MRVHDWVWWCVAVLSGGLLGLLVKARARRTGRHAPDHCGHCRRRRRAGAAASGALALVVLTGSGLWTHQQVSDPALPDCAAGVVADTWGESASSAGPLTQAWRDTRSVLTAPVTGIAYHYADTRGGGLCATKSVTVAFIPSAASDTALTVGDVFVTSLPEQEARAIASHESSHVSQWAVLTVAGGPLALPVLYSLDDTFFPGGRNHFERAAGLQKGNYHRPPDFGPKPQWDRVAGIALLLLVLFWRRLRWATRALLLGRAGARYAEPGRCRLHSRGWVSIGR